MVKIFVSYSRVDSDVMKTFAELLGYGCDVWYDAGIVGGQDWWKTIVGGIEQREHFVYLLSKDSVDSEYCQKELDKALELGKNIIPVRIRARTALPAKISHLQAIEAYGDHLADGTSRVYGAILKNMQVEDILTLAQTHRKADLKIVQSLWPLISTKVISQICRNIVMQEPIPLQHYFNTIDEYKMRREMPEYQMYNTSLQKAFQEFDKHLKILDRLIGKVYEMDDKLENWTLITSRNVNDEIVDKLETSQSEIINRLLDLSLAIRVELPEFIFPIE